jgi:hypothetical protein
VRPKLTYANIVASLALFVALGGSSYAAMELRKNSVTSESIGREQVKASDIAKNAVTSPKVKDFSLLAKDFKTGQLPAGPAGAPGERGPQGPRGLQGIQGVPGLSGLERVYASGVNTNSESPKIMQAQCAPGKAAISSGYDVVGAKEGSSPSGLANIVVDVLLPTSPSPGSTGSVFVEAWEEEPTALTWGIDAIALCANVAP